MRRRHAVLLTVALVSLPVALFGSGGFSSVVGDRDVGVAVADGADAYLGVSVGGTAGHVEGEPLQLLTLTDRLSGELTLRGLGALEGAGLVDLDPDPGAGDVRIGGPGDPLVVEATCQKVGTADIGFTVSAADGSTSVRVERSVSVECREPTPTPTPTPIQTSTASSDTPTGTSTSGGASTPTAAPSGSPAPTPTETETETETAPVTDAEG